MIKNVNYKDYEEAWKILGVNVRCLKKRMTNLKISGAM